MFSVTGPKMYLQSNVFSPAFLSADSQISISARVGSSAVLPCQLRNVPTETPQVEWQNNAETVFERFGQDLHQADGYTDRVDVPEHNLLKGNCSLELKNIRLDDEGVYESYLILKEGDRSKRVFIQRVKLSVEETDQEFVKGFLEDDIATQQALDLTGIIAFILILCILFP
uniref:Ig-like domain-containing protein n=1 Tax=Pygocentrus nattereri TaxID=42514 RepID=A0AAR2JNI2_PYGNA